MKRLLFFLLLFPALALAACGGGSTSRGARPRLDMLPVVASSSIFTGSVAFPQFQTPVAIDTTSDMAWQQGDQASTTNGSWSHSPTSFSYQWQDCDALGGSCSNILGATSHTYSLAAQDVGGTVRAVVTAYNDFGSTSAASAVSGIIVSSCSGGGFFGNQAVGGTANGGMGADFKRVTSATTSVSGELTKVTMYLSPTGTAGTQTLRNVVYDDSGGNPNAFLGISDQISFSQSNAAGSYDLVLPDSVAVTSGLTYWIGMITGPTNNVIQFNYDSVGGTTTWELNADTYSDGPTDPFGASSNSQPWQMSVYATVAPATAPVNTARPTISGTASVGSSLSTTNGTWSPAATSFGYQWQDCDSGGINCQYIGGATASSYTVATGDVGHTIRSVVLATNSCGSVSRTSTVSGVVAGSAPGNTALPSISGTTTQGQTLSISNGTWTGSPTSFTYQWRDCDSGGASCANATGSGNFCSNSGTGCDYVLTANDVAHTMRVIVTATNASGSTPATSPQSALVTGTTAPINTALPVISGTTTVGSVLSTTNGSWTSGGSAATCGGGVITCTYQWQRCAPGCSNISSATTNTYTLVSADLGDTIDVVVTATNGSGSTPATSAQTATITSGGGGQTLNCFNASSDGSNPSPGVCGYPDPNAASNTSGAWASSGVSGETGVGPVCDAGLQALMSCTLNTPVTCSSLPRSWGGGTMSGAPNLSGSTLSYTRITGSVVVNVANPTFHDDCVSVNGGGVHGSGQLVNLQAGSASGTATFTDVTLNYLNTTTQSGDVAIIDSAFLPVNVSHAYIVNCGECLHDGGPFTVTDSFVFASGEEPWETGVVEHTEVWYGNNDSSTWTHDVLLNPVLQEAVLFDDNLNAGACVAHVTVTKSLVSGGHSALELCPKASGAGSSALTITNNHFARCTTPSITVVTGDRSQCRSGGSSQDPPTNGADQHGFMPFGGATSPSNFTFCGSGGTTWSGNVWDDDGSTVSCS